MRIHQIIFALSLLLPFTFSTRVWAQSSRPLVSSALAFLESQQTVGGADGYDPGQWRSQVTSTLPTGIGVGKFDVPYEEPSAFVAASVVNVLAEIYFLDPSYSHVPSMVEKTKAGFKVYEMGAVYHFYPPKMYNGIPVRGPRYMFLNKRWWGFTNTPPDADTTSVSNLTLAYSQAIRQHTVPQKTQFRISDATTEAFVSERDEEGRVPHLYNQIHQDVDTGAYLTWLFNEKDPAMPHYYLARPDKGVRIPFDKNDVDCVVNANVLKMLTVSSRVNTPGYADTCNYLNDLAARSDFYHCGMYYPSSYALPYGMATAMHLGVSCLEPSRAPIVEQMLKWQNADGSWRNHWEARPDYIQSTAWALNTLLILGNPNDPEQRAAARKGIQFLVNHRQLDSQGRAFWSGEVFYAAIFIVRFPVVWRSTGYTTALAAKALVLADEVWKLK